MGRLIDADVFVKYANERLDLFADDLIQMINEQPIAYDVSKVVAELEEEKEIVKEYDKYHCSVRLDKAIDIVRKGGVND